MVNFFIDRPIFAWVIAIVIMLAGALAITTLPIAQYPSIAPPAISIQVIYPGASADTVQSTVTQVIEQQLSGIDHLLYFGSESDADGSMTITLYFEQGTNPDIAQVQVQNKLQLATPLLPLEVQQQGLRVAKATRNFLLVIGFYSNDGSLSSEDVSDYIASHVQDPISRTPGVGDYPAVRYPVRHAHLAGSGQAQQLRLTPVDVSNALQAQNVQVPVGELGGLPLGQGSAPERHHHRPAAPHQRRCSSAACCSRSIPTARRCGCGTWLASVWAPRATRSTPSTTATRRRASPSSWPPGANALETAERDTRHHGQAGAVLSRRAEAHLPLRHHPVRARLHR